MSKLGLSNMILFQWFGFRLAKKVGARTTWHILRWVWPLTGWWGRYYWIYRVWPSAESELVDGIAQEVAKDIDQAIVDDLFAPVIKPIGEWPPPPPPILPEDGGHIGRKAATSSPKPPLIPPRTKAKE